VWAHSVQAKAECRFGNYLLRLPLSMDECDSAITLVISENYRLAEHACGVATENISTCW
jgi:hypothetical protein